MPNEIHHLYFQLLKNYGHPIKLWPQWCAKNKSIRDREIICIGAILTQRISWRNVDMALNNLKQDNLLSLKKLSALKSLDKLTKLIKPTGFYQTKPKRVHNFASFVIAGYGDLQTFMKEDLKIARDNLLNLYGIGPETADVILTYALDKPSFVIDEYTKRFVTKHKLDTNLNYYHLQQVFEDKLPIELEVYQNYHALIIIEQRGRELSKMEYI